MKAFLIVSGITVAILASIAGLPAMAAVGGVFFGLALMIK